MSNALASGLASAQELRWHLGASIAQDYDKRATSDYTADGQGAKGLLGGVQFENGFGVELAYIDLGHLLSPGVLSGGFESEGQLWSLGATYGKRFDNIEPDARLGWFSRKENGRTIGIPGSQAIRGSDEGVVAELGLRWFVTDPLAVRLGCSRRAMRAARSWRSNGISEYIAARRALRSGIRQRIKVEPGYAVASRRHIRARVGTGRSAGEPMRGSRPVP